MFLQQIRQGKKIEGPRNLLIKRDLRDTVIKCMDPEGILNPKN